MYQNEREHEIIKILVRENYATVKQLSEQLFTSESSVRRDLKALEKQGMVKRSYGGAELAKSTSQILPFSTRAHRNVSAKKIMAKKAVHFVKEGDIVFLDQSSSSYYVAVELMKIPGVTVVTNNIEILTLLSQSDMQVISSGGHLSKSNRNCLIGTDAQRIFTEICGKWLFFSAKAMSRDGIIYDCDREEICLRNKMIENAEKKIFLCSSEKYGQTSGYRQCTVKDIDYIVTETQDKEKFKDLDGYKNMIH